MFTVTQKAPDLLHVEIGGKITAREMSEGLDTLLPMMRDMQDGKMLMIYQDIAMPEIAAIAQELKRLPQMFGVIGHVPKIALVSAQKWVRDMAELEGMIIPGTTIRSFTPDQRHAADAFLHRSDSDDDDFDNLPV